MKKRKVTEKTMATFVALKKGLTDERALEIVTELVEFMRDNLQLGVSVQLTNIGTLRMVKVPPRKINSFGKEQTVDEKVKVRFTMSRNFAEGRKETERKQEATKFEGEEYLRLYGSDDSEKEKEVMEQMKNLKLKTSFDGF